jgi:hypothetical protein
MLPSNKSKTFTVSLKLSALTFTLLLGYHVLWGRHFHKMRGTEAFSSSHKNLNTTKDNTGLRPFPHPLSYRTHTQEFKFFVFEISFDFFFFPFGGTGI